MTTDNDSTSATIRRCSRCGGETDTLIYVQDPTSKTQPLYETGVCQFCNLVLNRPRTASQYSELSERLKDAN